MTAAFNIHVVFKMICAVQALASASKTVDCLKVVHSLHAYFLLGVILTVCTFLTPCVELLWIAFLPNVITPLYHFLSISL